MTELIIMRGIPGSGKSTWANAWVAEDREHRARVNRDTLRAMIDGGEYVKGVTEGRILAARDAVIRDLIKRGISVVSDDTNLPSRTVRDLIKLAVTAKAEWRIEDLTNVPLDTCLNRNFYRKDKVPVPPEVIRDMYGRFIKNKEFSLPVLEEELYGAHEIVPYVPDRTLPPVIIVDIDGTVALKGTRSPFDETRVHEDRPNLSVIAAVQALAHQGNLIIFLSGRTDGCREETEKWLRQYVTQGWKPELHMRKQGDMRKDWIVKSELFDEHVRGKYNVVCVFDDRDQVVRLWRDMGLTCFQVAEGDF